MIGGVCIKEYGIYIRQGSGKPYMIHIFNNIYSAKQKLYEMILLEEERQRPYFVDNDFYKNKYNTTIKLKYFCIKEREVTDWQKYSKDNISNDKNNNILYLNNYKSC